MIWWDCQATDRVQRWPWSRSERAALAANGVQLQTEDEQLEWLGRAWLRPVLAARERCVFILLKGEVLDLFKAGFEGVGRDPADGWGP